MTREEWISLPIGAVIRFNDFALGFKMTGKVIRPKGGNYLNSWVYQILESSGGFHKVGDEAWDMADVCTHYDIVSLPEPEPSLNKPTSRLSNIDED